jgi:hypothetical protein
VTSWVNFLQTQHKRTEALHVSDELVMKADDANKNKNFKCYKVSYSKTATNIQTSTILQETKKKLFQSFKKKFLLKNILKHLTFSQDPTFASNKISVGKYYNILRGSFDQSRHNLLMNRSIHPSIVRS